MILAAAGRDSSLELPELTSWVGMMLGACFLAIVLGLVIVCVGVAFSKQGKKLFGVHWDPLDIAKAGAGAVILGSVSGAVLWGSQLYAPAKMTEPERVTPAYETVNDCEPVSLKTADDLEKTKAVIGESRFEEQNDVHFDFDGDGNILSGDVAKNYNVELHFKPQKGGDECSEELDPCYQVKVNYKTKGDFLGMERDEDAWWEANGYDAATCGPPKKF
ncbi:hypothetical protein NBM05_07335 [Rothia sp. AR01]|uniref:Uncharacterized protein n=1 Tax=Rothia santali TaxID=2949643 RepID=A0A9X2HJ44_9MICC|nr:hypothetical protein [Rothia santali]MCP3425823.1 hypothetical protein [Rothia santali]